MVGEPQFNPGGKGLNDLFMFGNLTFMYTIVLFTKCMHENELVVMAFKMCFGETKVMHKFILYKCI